MGKFVPKQLFKTTIVIWSEYDPFPRNTDIGDTDDGMASLVRESVSGDAYCSKVSSRLVEDPSKDKDWDGTEFFDGGEDDVSDDGSPAPW